MRCERCSLWQVDGRPRSIPMTPPAASPSELAFSLDDYAPAASRRRVAARRAARSGELRLPEGHLRGRSPGMESLYRALASVAPLDDAVLITGETGVGKEHVAGSWR